jgi:hypothetical protein
MATLRRSIYGPTSFIWRAEEKKRLLEVVTPAEDNPATAEPKPAPRIQTSVRLDPVMWAALNDLATRKRV